MKTILLFALLLSGLLIYGQHQSKEKFVKITMPKMPIAEFPENSIAVSAITVKQNVADSVRMGYTHKGVDFSIATLIFKEPLTEILQKQVNRMYKHAYKKKRGNPILDDQRFTFWCKTGRHRLQ